MSPADMFHIHAKYLVKWKVCARWTNMPYYWNARQGFFH